MPDSGTQGVTGSTGRAGPGGPGAPDLAPAGQLPDLEIPDLEIRREVARGGFGVVYEAHQPALNRTVALKLLLAEIRDETVRIRFERECTAMGLLSDHPHIITVFDAGFSPNGQPFILMDFMTGGSLADTIERDGPMDWVDVLAVTVQLASALETAHRSGVLHRDIKPENVLWSSYGRPELGDFGIARLAGGPETRTDTLTASIAHVAPELLAGDPPSIATDLYALGSTCYVLLSGRSAFLRDTDESIVPALSRIAAEPVPDLRTSGVPAEMARLVERLMAKDPADRFATALDLAAHCQDLQRRNALPITPIHVPGEPSVALGSSVTGQVTAPAPLDRTVDGVEPPPPGGSGPTGGPPLAGAATAPALPGPADAAQAAQTAQTAAPDLGDREEAAPTSPVPVDGPPRRSRIPVLAALGGVAVLAVAAVLLLTGGDPPADPLAQADTTDPGEDGADGPAVAEDGGEILDGSQVAAQIAEIRGLPLRGNADVRRYSPEQYSPLIREYAEAVQPLGLETHGRVLAALRLIPTDLDYPALMRDLYDEQFHGFFDESTARVHLRGSGGSLSAFERSVLADELMIELLDSAFDLSALHEEAEDLDADRALTALIKGDTFVSSGVWAERFLTAEESEQRTSDLGLLPDLVARSAPLAVRGEFVFPFVGGPDLVRSLFAEGGVEALDAAYDDPPTTTEQVLHPERYAAREPAIPVELTADPGEGWEVLVRRTFGEYDVQQLLAELEPEVTDAAAAGWGGGTLVAWTRGDETAVAVWLEMDTAEDGAELCDAVPGWYLLSGGQPAGDGGFRSGDDALALACDGAAVRFTVAPDAETADALLR